jgi:hypothetical protein
MNNDQWATICLHLEQGWRGDLDDDKRKVYATFLKEMPFEVALAAIHKLAQSGTPWLPTVPELTKAIESVVVGDVPSWPEAWSQIEKMITVAGRGWLPFSTVEVEPYSQPCAAYAEEVGAHPAVAAFCQQFGLRNLGQLPLFNNEHAELRMRQLSEQFTEYTASQQEQERRRRALRAAGLTPVGGVESAARKELPPAEAA